jgi:hypothetical protein
MPRSLNEAQFRGLVRKLVREYVTDTKGDPHKDVHADPTAKAWDTGLDEMDSSDLSQAGPAEGDLEDVGVEIFNCNACGFSCREDHPDYAVEYTCPECGHDNSMDDENGMSPPMDLGEVDGDPHADVHADPTAKSWDTGLE